MFGIKNKDLIMMGLIVGISLFFVGAMISNVFPSSSEELMGYKASAFIKMIGMGFIVSTMIVGGIILDDVDKSVRFILLLLGLILLMTYTFGAKILQWDISSYSAADSSISPSEAAYNERPTALGTPGFETITVILALISFFIVSKFKKLFNKT